MPAKALTSHRNSSVAIKPTPDYIRDDGGGRPKIVPSAAEDIAFITSELRQYCSTIDGDDWPHGSGHYHKIVCMLSLDKPEPGFITVHTRSGLGTTNSFEEFTRQDNDLIYTSHLSDLSDEDVDKANWTYARGAVYGYWGIDLWCKNRTKCWHVTGWVATDVGRQPVDTYENTNSFPINGPESKVIELCRAFARTISPNRSDLAFCRRNRQCEN